MTAEGFPAITLWQPWASLVACGAKQWETRGWQTKYRGPLRIHAAKVERPEEAALVALPAIHDALWPALGFDRRPMPSSVRERLPRGAIVATVNVVDCIPICEHSEDADDLIYQTVDGRALYRQQVIGDPSNPRNVIPTDLTDQLPVGVWETGGWGWRLADNAPTTDRCPECLGDAGFSGLPGCSTCDGEGSCDSVPARGMPGIWRWQP